MKAVVMRETGGPEVLSLEEVAKPEITSASQLKIRIAAAGVNPVDTKLRARGVFLSDGLPAILGCDAAGVVVEAGSEVTKFRSGDEVWYCNGGLGGLQGNYAEYAVVEESVCCKKPVSVDFAHAAAAPLVLITAWEALFGRARLTDDKTLLVHAGAGGVGHVAIQLAKQAGARVLTTVSTPEKQAFVTSLGADTAINYRERDFVDEVMRVTDGTGADVVLDTVGGDIFKASINATAHYGDLVTLLDPGPQVEWKEARNRNLRIGFTLMLTPMLRHLPQARANQVAILRDCAEMIDSGSLRIHVGDSLALEQANKAHELIEQGRMQGKLVLVP
ncbi:MAG: alcohol dehydrogenase [gamma proteobacterium symbiont of Ctena orbiculata]|uniref:Zinc-dependent alcohol dehydrogenase family protein n=1 Tax=Candidatus Thiodiazotropha taylori TaxID=2792791 RepID=A0A944M910_9GAMM|nr:zinc-dependent alcohol dehydrogenase family protein [Candidatus Thiodiazotropha taylori]PVV09593.1 MAG: alcohol dehydrogenase [gamma proteobacterium symbiont of Ctena orbiculata]MBT2989473.1 zinc-dependent alcohol dehydrogenase family protein [Candidatus Thiodiazotropha taylori]MBT2997053.1 zinc-dependent alcohol dehydrogenase family protein [Candidatus Thiodiazotropha taylori]MBT3002915.1 zinc-dependent alcohol dehydrogenase family protein [Candidatus Thiodiazotropha taylori]